MPETSDYRRIVRLRFFVLRATAQGPADMIGTKIDQARLSFSVKACLSLAEMMTRRDPCNSLLITFTFSFGSNDLLL